MIREFQYQPSRWAQLTIDVTVTQADVDSLFATVDTSNWVTKPTWDNVEKILRWQVIASPFGPLQVLSAGWVVAVERPYVNGIPTTTWPQAQVVVYPPTTWLDTAVTYLP